MQIYWDFENRKIVEGLRDPQIPTLVMASRDLVPLSLALVSRSADSDPYVAQELAAGETLLFAARESIDASEYLFYVAEDDWTDPTDEDAPRYTAEADLNTNPLVEAMGASKTKRVLGELAIVKTVGGDDRHYYTTRVAVTITNDIITNAVAPSSAEFSPRTIGGVLHLYNATLGKFLPVNAVGGVGEETISIGEDSEGVAP